MANHVTMGSGGVDVDMVTGRPAVPKPFLVKDKARARLRNAIGDAMGISADLHQNNQVLKIYLTQYQKRLMEFAANDPICQALEAPIRAIRDKLEVAPVLAEREAMRIMGPNLAALAEEETEAAP